MIQNSEYLYTQSFCFLQCIQRTILLECNCTDPAINSLFSNSSQCIELSEINCMISLSKNKILPNNNFYEKNCQSECPLECYSYSFDFSLSSSELIYKNYFDYLISNSTNLSEDLATEKIDAETARRSFAWTNIFYKSLSYEMSCESPQLNLITLFANIGGYLGLFLGVSMFSLFEPIQVLIEILYMKCQKRQK